MRHRSLTAAAAAVITAILATVTIAAATTTGAPRAAATTGPTRPAPAALPCQWFCKTWPTATPVPSTPRPSSSTSTSTPAPTPTSSTSTPAPTTSTTAPSPTTSTGTRLTDCFTRLAACGYPSKATTGMPSGTTLKTYSGPTTLSKATTLDGYRLPCLTIRATVVIRNSTITGPCFWALDVESGSLTVEDTTIDCVDYGGTGIAERNFTVRRVQILRCENGADVSWGNITIVDSYVGDIREVNGGHGDGIQISGDTINLDHVTLRHNTFDLNAGITSSIEMDSAPASNLDIEGNLFAAGAYTVYCPYASRGPVVFRDNRFAATGKHAPSYGFTTSCGPSVTWSGNYRDDNLKAVRAE